MERCTRAGKFREAKANDHSHCTVLLGGAGGNVCWERGCIAHQPRIKCHIFVVGIDFPLPQCVRLIGMVTRTGKANESGQDKQIGKTICYFSLRYSATAVRKSEI